VAESVSEVESSGGGDKVWDQKSDHKSETSRQCTK
jgi:hypothetical protein